MTGERFVARVSRGRILLVVLGALAFVVLGASAVLDPDLASHSRRYSAEVMYLIGWVGILFFGACAMVGIRELLRTEPVMEIGPEGLRWRRWSDETIPWTAFERAAVMKMYRQRMVTLWLRDPTAYTSTGLLGRTSGANKALGFGDISLSASGLDYGFDAMARAVASNAPQLFED